MNIKSRTKRLENIALELGRQDILTEDILLAQIDNQETDIAIVKKGMKEIKIIMETIRFYESV